jgi:hypothetical protein
METEGSLLCSQKPSTGPYAEVDECSSIQPHPISLRSILILSFRLHLTKLRGLSPQANYTDRSPTSRSI